MLPSLFNLLKMVEQRLSFKIMSSFKIVAHKQQCDDTNLSSVLKRFVVKSGAIKRAPVSNKSLSTVGKLTPSTDCQKGIEIIVQRPDQTKVILCNGFVYLD